MAGLYHGRFDWLSCWSWDVRFDLFDGDLVHLAWHARWVSWLVWQRLFNLHLLKENGNVLKVALVRWLLSNCSSYISLNLRCWSLIRYHSATRIQISLTRFSLQLQTIFQQVTLLEAILFHPNTWLAPSHIHASPYFCLSFFLSLKQPKRLSNQIDFAAKVKISPWFQCLLSTYHRESIFHFWLGCVVLWSY